MCVTSPTHPITVCISPTETLGVIFFMRSNVKRFSTCDDSAFFFNRMIIFSPRIFSKQQRPRFQWSGAVGEIVDFLKFVFRKTFPLRV
jgi:hypothetical protein